MIVIILVFALFATFIAVEGLIMNIVHGDHSDDSFYFWATIAACILWGIFYHLTH